MITVIIHTKNAQDTIRRAIMSVKKFADEILIADMQSSDKTIQIAKSLDATVMSIKDVGYADPARQAMLEKAKYPWIFVLDADEMISPELAREIKKKCLIKICRISRMSKKLWINPLCTN